MIINIEGLNDRQLASLIKSAKDRKDQLSKQRFADVRAKILALLEVQGLTLAQVFAAGNKVVKRRRSSAR